MGRYSDGKRDILAVEPNRFGRIVFLRISVDGAETARFLISSDGKRWKELDPRIYFGDSWHDLRDGVGGNPDLGWVGIGKRNVWTATTMGIFAVGGQSDESRNADFDWFKVTRD